MNKNGGRDIDKNLFFDGCHEDEVAEWLRRWTATPLCFARVGSNPTLVALFFLLILLFFALLYLEIYYF